MEKLYANKFLLMYIVGILHGISSTVINLDTNKTGTDDIIGQSLKSFAETLQAVLEGNKNKTTTALKALVAAATSWISFLEEKETEKNSSGLPGVEVTVNQF